MSSAPPPPSHAGAAVHARRTAGALAVSTACLALAAMCLVLAAANVLAAEGPRASLTSVERQVMCVTCKIPLNVAESPQANRERAFIRELIDEGRDEAQIKHALVGQYGTTVLALPPASGFDLTVYIVPVAVVAVLVALLAILLPRWRRRGREPGGDEGGAAPLGPGDASRLEADLSRFD